MKKSILALFSIIILSCSPTIFKKKWTEEIAPESYTTRFETNKGNFDLKVTRSLSPKAADRFYQLVKHSYFDDVLFYRVNPGFVVQFGSSDSIKRQAWDNVKVPDEKTVQSNTRGTLSFARGGKDTRSTDLFINLGENSRLDTLYYQDVTGFPSFGEVTQGMSVVESLYSGYSDAVMQDFELMIRDRDSFLIKYPKLDKVEKAYLLD
ncbi:MAG: peptidylprolyl isomerase [Flavobacteriaceae bacterium]